MFCRFFGGCKMSENLEFFFKLSKTTCCLLNLKIRAIYYLYNIIIRIENKSYRSFLILKFDQIFRRCPKTSLFVLCSSGNV